MRSHDTEGTLVLVWIFFLFFSYCNAISHLFWNRDGGVIDVGYFSFKIVHLVFRSYSRRNRYWVFRRLDTKLHALGERLPIELHGILGRDSNDMVIDGNLKNSGRENEVENGYLTNPRQQGVPSEAIPTWQGTQN